MRQSKSVAFAAMAMIIVLIIVAMATHIVSELWEYIPLFLCFMAVFCHLAAVMLVGMSRTASKKLDIVALIFGILAIIALIVTFILNWIAF